MVLGFPLLSLLLLVPLLGSVAVFLVRGARAARWMALAVSLVSLALATVLLLGVVTTWVDLGTYDAGRYEYKAYESAPWIPVLNAQYLLGADGLSGPLVFLNALLTTLAILFQFDEKHRPREFFAMLLLMQVTVAGVFLALDFLLFFLFWEVGLAPMYFLIAIWGGPNRRYAALKFFLYTQAASLLVLLGILVFYLYGGTFSMVALLESTPIPLGIVSDLLFLSLLVGFGAKLPMVPFHTWLPDAHVEAPTSGSVLLAGILLKLGGYGIIRVPVQMMPETAVKLVSVVAFLGIVSILYGAIVSLVQDDLKRLVAYSSVSHMGFVLLGVAAGIKGSVIGMAGAIFMMFAHGLISPAMFMVAGAVGHHVGTRNVSALKGLAAKMPVTATFTITAFLASLGLPGLVGFVAEFAVFLGTYEAFGLWLLVPLVSAVLTAAYYLWAVQRAFHGPPKEDLHPHADLTWYERVPLGILTAAFALFGILPLTVLAAMTAWSAVAFGGP